jgi:hypothetical protein
LGNIRERDNLKIPWHRLKDMFDIKRMGGQNSDSCSSGQGQAVYEHSSELSVSTKCLEFLD